MFGLSSEGPVDESFIHSRIPTHLVGDVAQTCVGMKRMVGRRRKGKVRDGREWPLWDGTLGAAAGGDCPCGEQGGLRVTNGRPLSFRGWQTAGQPGGRGSPGCPAYEATGETQAFPLPIPCHFAAIRA